MEVSFANRKLQKQCSNQSECLRKWGDRRGHLIMKRLQELAAMENLATASTMPHLKCHELAQNRKGEFSVVLEHPYRLVFEPADEPPSRKEDGGYDWDRIRKIRILEVVDYHG